MTDPTKAGRERALADLKDTISDCCDMEEAYRRGYQAGRESMREELALDDLETKYSYAEILQMAAEAIRALPLKESK